MLFHNFIEHLGDTIAKRQGEIDLKNWWKNAIIGSLSGFLNGMFGSGGGLIAVPLLEKLSNAEPKKAHATSVSIILPLSVISAFLYLNHGHLDIYTALKYVPFGILGAIIGGWLLKKFSNKILKKTFAVLLIFAAIRMVVRLWN